MNSDDSPKGSDDLAELVRQVSREVRTLWEAVDDLREEIFAEFESLRGAPLEDSAEEPARPFRLISMPLDPCASDFHKRVNAIDLTTAELEPATLPDFLRRLTQQPPKKRLSVENWVEDQDFDPDGTVEIDAEIFDWFAEYLVTVHREGDCYILDNGEGSHYLLWNRDACCFARRLSDEQEAQLFRLSGIVCETPDTDKECRENQRVDERSRSSEIQGTLW